MDADFFFLASALSLAHQGCRWHLGEGDFDLRRATGRGYAIEVKLTKQTAVGRHFTLALEDLNGYRRLIIHGRRKDLALRGWNGGIAQ